jgi:hypothetical protein
VVFPTFITLEMAMKMRAHFVFVFLGVLLFAGGHVAAQEMRSEAKVDTSESRLAAAQAQRAGVLLLAPVKSQFELGAYLQSAKASPLDWLSPAAKRRFLASLTFNETGLTGFDYSDLRAELTFTQIHRVLAIFGAQRVAPLIKGARAETDIDRILMASPGNSTDPSMDDHEGYRCEGAHTCGSAPSRICMSGC